MGHVFKFVEKSSAAEEVTKAVKERLTVEALARSLRILLEEDMRQLRVQGEDDSPLTELTIHHLQLLMANKKEDLEEELQEDYDPFWVQMKNTLVQCFAYDPSNELTAFKEKDLLTDRAATLTGICLREDSALLSLQPKTEEEWKEFMKMMSASDIYVIPQRKKFQVKPFVNYIALRKKGAFDEIEELYLKELETREKQLGPDHKELVPLLQNLAILYSNDASTTQKLVDTSHRALELLKKHGDYNLQGESYLRLGERYMVFTCLFLLIRSKFQTTKKQKKRLKKQ